MKVNKMQKILVNGKSTVIEDFINLFQHDDEFDADSFDACRSPRNIEEHMEQPHERAVEGVQL